MIKGKLSEFSSTAGNITYSEDRENLDITGNPNNTKKKLQKEDTIKTYCRIRQIENNPGIFKIAQEDEKSLKVIHEEVNNQPQINSLKNFSSPNFNSFNFSKIFDAQATQMEVFTSTCVPLIEDLIKTKKSGLIFAYGLTNAGKTHTIIGNPTNPGILPLTLRGIYEMIESEIVLGNMEIAPEIFCNYIEIYNEEVFDLLANNGKSDKCKKKVYIKEKDKIFYVQNVTNKPVKSIDDFNDALNLGVMKKTHASTQLNNYSSRSHTIFKLIIRWPFNKSNNFNDSQDVNDSEYEESTLSIVDLAGSERAYRAETSGKELQQACKINHSLYVLGKCMEIMKHNSLYLNKKIVPFRESKLTMLFQEYFQGDQNIIMITNINPSRDDFEETIRVLSYACIAKEIRPIKSKIMTTNNLRKKDKNSIYDSCSSEDEEKKMNNKLTTNSYKYDSSNISSINTNNIFNSNQNFSMQFRESYRNLNISGLPPQNSINHLSHHNSTFADDIEMLKYEFMNMSRRYEEQLEKYEELERKNEFLLSKYKEMQFQFKLRELDMRTQMIESISNQLINNKFESLINELQSSIKQDNQSSLVVKNPFYYEKPAVKNFIGQSYLKEKKIVDPFNSLNKNLENKKKDVEEKELKKKQELSEKKDYENLKNNLMQDSLVKMKEKEFDDNKSKKEIEKGNQIQDQQDKEKSKLENVSNKEENKTKNLFKPKTKKKNLHSNIYNKKEEDRSEEENKDIDEETVMKTQKEKSEVETSKIGLKAKKSNFNTNSFISKKEEDEPSFTKNKNFKKSLKKKEKEKSFIEEEDTNILSDLDTIVTKSNESSPSPIKAKNKKNFKKQTKSKKNYRKGNKTNSDTESDLDYSIDSVYSKHLSFKNKKSSDYEDEIEEEKSDFLEEAKESFKEVKKNKKKSKKTKKSKKVK